MDLSSHDAVSNKPAHPRSAIVVSKGGRQICSSSEERMAQTSAPQVVTELVLKFRFKRLPDYAKATEQAQKVARLRQGHGVSPAKSCVESFVHRAHGVLIARGSGSERWKEARGHFQRAVDAHPSNSNALFQLGMCALELGPLEMAIELMNKSLLLDSDFRAPYVNLGVAYLRQAAHADDPHKAQDFYLRAMEISEACLMRHPASPQCNYHIGVACTQLAFYLQDGEGVDCKDARFIELRGRAAREFLEARGSVEAARRLSDWQEAQARGIAKKQQAPWLSVDDKMLQAVEVHMMQGQTLKPIKIPEFIGWRLFFWRV